MSKKISEVKTMVEKLKEKHQADLAKLETERNAIEAKLVTLRSDRDRVETADQYKSLSREIHENEDVLVFFDKKKRELDAPMLSKEEYTSIETEVEKAFVLVKAEHSKTIFTDMDKLISDLTAYFKECEELNGLLQILGNLNKANPKSLNAGSIVNRLDPNDRYHQFFDAYMNLQKMLKYQEFHG